MFQYFPLIISKYAGQIKLTLHLQESILSIGINEITMAIKALISNYVLVKPLVVITHVSHIFNNGLVKPELHRCS